MQIVSGIVTENPNTPLWEPKPVKPITEPGSFIAALSGIHPGIVIEPDLTQTEKEKTVAAIAKQWSNQPWVVRDNELDCYFGPFETELEANTWLSDHEETEELWDADVIQLLKPKK